MQTKSEVPKNDVKPSIKIVLQKVECGKRKISKEREKKGKVYYEKPLTLKIILLRILQEYSCMIQIEKSISSNNDGSYKKNLRETRQNERIEAKNKNKITFTK